jgi:hypothetical protein
MLYILLLLGCSSSSVYRTEELRTHIQRNLFSTEHLAFGADPRSVQAIRSLTTEEDIPALLPLLSDTNPAIVRVTQYVLVSYEDKALPHLEELLTSPIDSTSIAFLTTEMIRNRRTR